MRLFTLQLTAGPTRIIFEAVCPNPGGDTTFSLGEPPFLAATCLLTSSLVALFFTEVCPSVEELLGCTGGMSFKDIGS